MKTESAMIQERRRRQWAGSVLEVVVGVALLGILFVSLFGGMTMTTAQTRAAREELRATQVMLERLEGIRLFNWNQLVYSNTMCPSTFTTSFAPNTGSTGITYYGTMTITNALPGSGVGYSNQIRAITVSVLWTNLGFPHTRSMTTYQAQYGMQNYIFNN